MPIKFQRKFSTFYWLNLNHEKSTFPSIYSISDREFVNLIISLDSYFNQPQHSNNSKAENHFKTLNIFLEFSDKIFPDFPLSAMQLV